jgi:hypothetical protein
MAWDRKSSKEDQAILVETTQKRGRFFRFNNYDANYGRNSMRDIRLFHNANKKLTRTAFCIIVAFLVCWTPNQILNVVYTFNPSYATYHVFIITSKLSEILAMCNSCVTPLGKESKTLFALFLKVKCVF